MGTRVALVATKVQNSEMFKETFLKISALNFEAQKCGFKIQVPEVFETSAQDGEELEHIILDEVLEEGSFYASIHSGMKGWYVNGVSTTNAIKVGIHDKFEKYGFTQSTLANPTQVVGVEGDAQDLYSKYTSSVPDERYAI